jgi:hypothetical protein
MNEEIETISRPTKFELLFYKAKQLICNLCPTGLCQFQSTFLFLMRPPETLEELRACKAWQSWLMRPLYILEIWVQIFLICLRWDLALEHFLLIFVFIFTNNVRSIPIDKFPQALYHNMRVERDHLKCNFQIY